MANNQPSSFPTLTVREAGRDLVRHPVRHLVLGWNWKNALFVTGIRGLLFFVTNLPAGVPSAVRAMIVDALFRAPLSGVYPAVTQAFRAVEPAWAALVVVGAITPAGGHTIELAVHWLAGTPELETSVAASVALSLLATLFNLFAMRRGFFIVGPGGRPFRDDLARLPGLIIEFVTAPVRTSNRRTWNAEPEPRTPHPAPRTIGHG